MTPGRRGSDSGEVERGHCTGEDKGLGSPFDNGFVSRVAAIHRNFFHRMILHWVPLQLTVPVVSSEMIHIPPETLEMKTRKGALKEKGNKIKDKRERVHH